MVPASFSLAPAEPQDFETVRRMLRAYQAEIGVDLCFQGFEAELAGLPGAYAPPAGCLLMLRAADEPAGCVAMRPAGDGAAEMKRLYLVPSLRGRGLGRWMANAIIEEAQQAGYRRLRLDTLPSMTEAAALYASLGFRPVEPAGEPPVAGMRYFELELEGVNAA